MLHELSLKAESLEELKRMVAEWATELAGTPAPHHAMANDTGALEADGLRKALLKIHGADARRFYLDVAEAVLRGEVLFADNELLRKYGKTDGRSFSGIQAGATRVLDRILHRRVILWPDGGGYSMSLEDARIVSEVFGKDRR